MAGESTPGNLLVPGPAEELAKDNASDHLNDDLPRAQIKRIVQRKLAALAGTGAGAGAGAGASTSRPMTVSTDAVVAFTESATMFVTMLAAAASDVCSETDKKRQTINANDVFKALEELEMPDLNEPLKASLEAFKKEAEEKAKTKKRKAAENTAAAAAAAAAAATAAASPPPVEGAAVPMAVEPVG
ncbi:DNA polymerase epsilon subunit 3 [Pycnococcus provasolii]